MTKRSALILLLLILAIAIFFRFYKLDEIPPGLYPDVAMNGNDALRALNTGDFKLFYLENNGREGLFINLIALSFAIFGLSVWAIKIVAALFGILTVFGIYLLTKELFRYIDEKLSINSRNLNDQKNLPYPLFIKEGGLPPLKKEGWLCPSEALCEGGGGFSTSNIIALLSAFFLAISFWHVNFSRIGFRAIMVPFFLVWSLYFLFKALSATRIYELHPNDPNKIPPNPPLLKGGNGGISGFWFLVSGLFFGLGFHTYIAFRVAPLILVPIIVIEIIKYWPRFKSLIAQKLPLGSLCKQVYIKDGWWHWDIFFAAVILAALPLAIYYFQHPADFMGRAGQVYIFASQNPIKTLAESTLKTLGQFVVWGDANWRHNLSGSPQIFWPLIPFFIIGLFYSFVQIFKKRHYLRENLPLATCHWTLIVWWGTMLLPSIMTSEGLPHALRSIGAIPPSYIFTALGFWLVIKLSLRPIRSRAAGEAIPSGNRQRLLSTGSLRTNALGMTLCVILIFAFCIVTLYFSYKAYFIDWAANPNVKGAFTQRFVDEANYLNSLSSNIIKYVIVNEPGTPVPFPDGIPMPAQTIIFITNAKQPPTQIILLKPEQVNQIPISCCQKSPAVILPMADDNDLLAQLKNIFPNGSIEKQNNFSVFKIGF